MQELATLLLHEFKFKALLLFQEGVAASFGAGMTSACVVDIGDQKVSVSCVEDGISLPHTRIHMSFGGRDVTRLLNWLLVRSGLPHRSCSMDNNRDFSFLQELKETICHLKPACISFISGVLLKPAAPDAPAPTGPEFRRV